MSLSEEARSRLADVVALQPTKNAELQERWGMESGSEVHRYLEDELGGYYYRDENSLIRATDEAAELVDVAPGVEGDDGQEGPRVVRVPELQYHVLEVIAAPDEDPQSVVSVLHSVRDAGHEAEVDEVRSALRSLADKGVVETIRKTVPTFRLRRPRDGLEVEPLDAAPDRDAPAETSSDGSALDGIGAEFE